MLAGASGIVLARRTAGLGALAGLSTAHLSVPASSAAISVSGPAQNGVYVLTNEEQDALDMWSRSAPGVEAPNGVRVIDVAVGTGPQPKKGDKVYCHFKVWTGGFRASTPADSSFRQARVYEWYLGTPTARMPVGADAGALGMREGGWRRLVLPASMAYGTEGLKMAGANGKETGVYAVAPDTPVFFDLRMVDGGSGKCEAILHPPGVNEKAAQRLRSISCKRGVP